MRKATYYLASALLLASASLLSSCGNSSSTTDTTTTTPTSTLGTDSAATKVGGTGTAESKDAMAPGAGEMSDTTKKM